MSSVIESVPQTQNLTGNFNGQTVKLRQITVEEYDAMIENGVFDENDRVELLNGAIVEKMPKGSKHSAATYRIAKDFFKTFDELAIVRIQDPILLDDFSEPEPDIVLAVPRADEYENSHPTPDEIYLILEVSDSTLGYDRNTKGEAYSRAGIRQYLVLNIQEKTLEDYREPSADGFQSKQTLRAGQQFNLIAFPDITLNVSDFFPV
ncbi:Uma2 family endonuclease [soil metagenome]